MWKIIFDECYPRSLANVNPFENYGWCLSSVPEWLVDYLHILSPSKNPKEKCLIVSNSRSWWPIAQETLFAITAEWHVAPAYWNQMSSTSIPSNWGHKEFVAIMKTIDGNCIDSANPKSTPQSHSRWMYGGLIDFHSPKFDSYVCSCSHRNTPHRWRSSSKNRHQFIDASIFNLIFLFNFRKPLCNLILIIA